MSADDIRTVREAAEAMTRGDWDAALQTLAEDVEWDTSFRAGGGIYHGHPGVVHNVGEWFATWESYGQVTESIEDLGGGIVLSVVRERGRGRGSGVRIDHRIAALQTVRDGKITRVKFFPSREEALAEAGA
jgi:ketosteroid isomerase-like protein